jgi:23S rRNA maturation mini-RNase III
MTLTTEDKRELELFLRTLDVRNWEQLGEIVELHPNSVRSKVANRQPLAMWELCEWLTAAKEQHLTKRVTNRQPART